MKLRAIGAEAGAGLIRYGYGREDSTKKMVMLMVTVNKTIGFATKLAVEEELILGLGLPCRSLDGFWVRRNMLMTLSEQGAVFGLRF